MEGYFTYLFSLPFDRLWVLLLLGMARILPIFSICPLFGGKIVPDSAKMGFGLGVTMIFLPYIASMADRDITIDFEFILLMVKEIFIGASMGFLASIPYFVAQSAGSLIDQQRGAQSLQVSDPSSASPSSPIGNVFGNLLIVIFYAAGGGILFFEIFFASYQIIPPTSFINPLFFTLDKSFWVSMIGICGLVLQITLQLAAPALLILLLSDVFLGVANRMAPQVQITFLLSSLKAWVGMAIILLGWWFLLKQFDVELLSWFKILKNILYSFS